MANDTCHAAGQTTYDVHEVFEDTPAAPDALRFSCDNLYEAIEFALDYLQSEEREVAALRIVKRSPQGAEVVWSYRHDPAPEREDPIRRWGFHPAQAWRLPAAKRSSG